MFSSTNGLKTGQSINCVDSAPTLLLLFYIRNATVLVTNGDVACTKALVLRLLFCFFASELWTLLFSWSEGRSRVYGTIRMHVHVPQTEQVAILMVSIPVGNTARGLCKLSNSVHYLPTCLVFLCFPVCKSNVEMELYMILLDISCVNLLFWFISRNFFHAVLAWLWKLRKLGRFTSEPGLIWSSSNKKSKKITN
jgi:hypothetical protein